MESLLHHSTLPDRSASLRTWAAQVFRRIANWIWPPLAPNAGARDGDSEAQQQTLAIDARSGIDAQSRNAMRWVPFVIPLAALFLLLLTAFIGSWL